LQKELLRLPAGRSPDPAIKIDVHSFIPLCFHIRC
jgi:hypothetical protein